MPRQSDGKSLVKRRVALEDKEKKLMFAVLIRNMEAFSAVKDALTLERFQEFDVVYKLAWTLVLAHYKDFNELPGKEFLSAAIQDADSTDQELLNTPEYEAIMDFIDFAFDPKNFGVTSTQPDIDVRESAAKYAIVKCKRFLEESLSNEVKDVLRSQKLLPVDMPDLLEQLAVKAEQISTLDVGDVDTLAFGTNWDTRVKLRIFPTNMPFLDRFMGGGQAGGEVYGFLGPFGSCKTTIAAMMVGEAARVFHERTTAADYDGMPSLAFAFSYEEPKKDMQARVLGYTAQIARDKMERIDSMADFTRADSLSDYEQRLFRNDLVNGKPVRGEYERAVDAIQKLNAHVILMDMTGETNAGLGFGGIREISRIINTTCRKLKARCGLVLIDYVGAMITKQATANNWDSDKQFQMLKAVQLQAKNEIAIEYDVPVWLMHQFSGEANNKGSTVVADHTNAAGNKSFAENLHFSFVTSKPENLTGLAIIECKKHRRQPGMLPTIIRVEGHMYRVIDQDDLYTIQKGKRTFILKSEVGSLPTQRTDTALPEISAGGAVSRDDYYDEPISPEDDSVDDEGGEQ